MNLKFSDENVLMMKLYFFQGNPKFTNQSGFSDEVPKLLLKQDILLSSKVIKISSLSDKITIFLNFQIY